MALSLARTASASTVIAVPGPVGDAANGLPFGGVAAGASLRYQQVYGASAFSPIGQGGLITALGFNIKSGGAFGGPQPPDIQIDFSTTSKPVDGLSTTFAANVGGDDTVVVARGPLGIQNNNPNAPPGFGILVSLTTPFFYNPAAGNLLMDVRYYQLPSGGFPSLYDASNDLGDTVSRVSAFNVVDATGIADTIGLNTAFVVTPVPEPGSGILLLAGLSVLAIFIRPLTLRRSPRN